MASASACERVSCNVLSLKGNALVTCIGYRGRQVNIVDNLFGNPNIRPLSRKTMAGKTKIVEFNREGAKQFVKSTERIGEYLIDVFVNAKVDPPVFHYIITRTGNTEILYWGQELNMREAQQRARETVSSILSERRDVTAG